MNFLCNEREIQILCMEGRNCEKLEKGEPTSRAGKKKNLGHDAAPVGRCCVTRPTRTTWGNARAKAEPLHCERTASILRTLHLTSRVPATIARMECRSTRTMMWRPINMASSAPVTKVVSASATPPSMLVGGRSRRRHGGRGSGPPWSRWLPLGPSHM